MSLMFDDPEKYLELMEKFAREEKQMQEESLKKVREASDGDIMAGLKFMGAVLTHIRIDKGYTLRNFVLQEFKGEEGMASRISNIERGLDIPSPAIIQKYLNILKIETNQTTNKISSSDT